MQKRDVSTSVYYFLRNCDDFKQEKSQMQHVLDDKLGSSLRMTPKYHPEIAGQGIKYAWGYSELRFRLHFNDTQACNLEKNVRAALGTNVLTMEWIAKFARKAQDYKMTYLFLMEQSEPNKTCTAHVKIEQIMKEFKHHRSALDSDHAFIKNA